MIVGLKRIVAACLAVSATLAPLAAHAQRHGPGGPGPGGLGEVMLEALGAIGSKARELNQEALRTYNDHPRPGTCEERRQWLLAELPEVLRLSGYAKDIYERDYETEMRAAHQSSLKISDDRLAYYDADGQRYAEARIDDKTGEVDVTFRGTRPSVRSDLTTDMLSFAGIPTAYYDWAATLVGTVAREHPGMKVVATGHSLGGGLALYAVLRNPGVTGVVFNPAGLNDGIWRAASAQDRARVNAAITAVSIKGLFSLDPITSLSLAGRSVLPGHVIVLQSNIIRPVVLHSLSSIIAGLDDMSRHDAQGSACDGDLGVLAE